MPLNKTPIEWVKNPDGSPGYTFNPITGCLNCTPDGLCLGGNFPCYAYKLANGRLRTRYLANQNIAGDQSGYKENVIAHQQDPFYPRFWEDRLGDFDNLFAINEPNFLRKLPKKPKGIFVCDMSDLFGVGIPDSWTKRVMDLIEACDYHRFYLLTKQPQNLVKFSPFPDNCWVGVTATDERMAMDAIIYLADNKTELRYLSLEPMLARIHLPPSYLRDCNIDWVIIGAQTKPYKPPKIEWVQEIVEACDKAGVPVFLKDNLYPLIHDESLVRHRGLFRTEYGLRQELPRK